jgi:hypothetical protein
MEAIKELVKLGLGISILAPWTCRKELDERSLVRCPSVVANSGAGGACCTGAERGSLSRRKTFIGLCEQVAERLRITLPIFRREFRKSLKSSIFASDVNTRLQVVDTSSSGHRAPSLVFFFFFFLYFRAGSNYFRAKSGLGSPPRSDIIYHT